jgi:AbrB family transcriptional regulator (stage V sporulation protein T)
LERKISKGLEEIVESRSLYVRGNGSEPISVINDGGAHYVNCAMPILSEGDIVGCVVSAWQYNHPTNGKISDDIESKLVQTAGMFLGRQMEG